VTRADELRGRLIDLDLDHGLTLELQAVGPNDSDAYSSPGPELESRRRQVALGNVVTLEE
jgi:hypothetical protein